MRTDELDYHLPPELIATEPAQPRDAARLMVIDRQDAGEHEVQHKRVSDLPAFLRPTDLLVVNESRVVPAYITGVRRATGGRVTGLYIDQLRDQSDAMIWSVLLESGGKLQPGDVVDFDDAASIELLERNDEGMWRAKLLADCETLALLSRIGSPPLPPYIRKARRRLQRDEVTDRDRERYNTVYATQPGSIAAPTAGLHFTPELLSRIDSLGVRRATVTLHVGLGTFAPVRTDTIEAHDIHREFISIPAGTIDAIRKTREQGGRVIPVGTTTVRALESLPDPLPQLSPGAAFECDTDLFITPGSGFTFRFTDALMTNFHLPRSTLLALVAALPDMGIDRLKNHYNAAVESGYRFYSYGDAMVVF